MTGGMFSVVIPAFNARATLPRAVHSVLRQQGPEFELIVVDDGSTDGCAASLAEIDDPRLRVLRQANRGGGAARDTGIEAAAHEWVALLDADDIWLDGHLAELDRIRIAFPDAGLIGTAEFSAPAGTASVRVPRRSSDIRLIRYFAAVGRGESTFNASSAALRKQAWTDVGRVDPSCGGPDRELWARLALSWKVAVSSRVTSVYVRGAGTDTDQLKGKRRGKPLSSVADLSDSVATLLERHAESDPDVQQDIESYILRYFDYRLREAAAGRDLVVLRSLAHLYRVRPPLQHRLVFALSRLPRPIAAPACRLAFSPLSAAHRLSRLLNREPHDLVSLT